MAPSRERQFVIEECEEKLHTDHERALAPGFRAHAAPILEHYLHRLQATAEGRLWSTHARLLEEASEFTRVLNDDQLHPDVARVMEISLASANAYIDANGRDLEPWFYTWRSICAQLGAKFLGASSESGEGDFLNAVIEVLQRMSTKDTSHTTTQPPPGSCHMLREIVRSLHASGAMWHSQWRWLFEWMLVGVIDFQHRDDKALAVQTLALLVAGALKYEEVDARAAWERCDEQLR